MSDPLVVVCTVAGHLEAARIQSLLEAEGIPAMISQEGAGQVYGLTVGLLGEADVLVPASRLDEARTCLAVMLSADMPSPDFSPGDQSPDELSAEPGDHAEP